VPIVHSTCQDTTDLEKCIRLLLQSRAHPTGADGDVRSAFVTFWQTHTLDTHTPLSALHSPCAADTSESRPIILFGTFGGRFDHEIATVNVLHRCLGIPYGFV
jgi:thiamine pyrophosphokinase